MSSYEKSIEQVHIYAVVAVGARDRENCAEHLANFFGIIKSKRVYLLALLDFMQSDPSPEQVQVLRDDEPATSHGSGIISSIGLLFAD